MSKFKELAERLRNAEEKNMRRGYAGEWAYYKFAEIDEVAQLLEGLAS